MKKKLLITTALAGFVFSVPAMAVDYDGTDKTEREFTVDADKIIDGDTFSNYDMMKQPKRYDSGVIQLRGGTLNISNSTFVNNTAYVAGAVGDVYNVQVKTIIKDSKFENNIAKWDAGALGMYSDVEIYNTDFTDNYAGVDVSNSDGGGAILFGGTATGKIVGGKFENNESAVRGGAISARHGKTYTLSLDGVKFSSNKAGNFGGAIASIYGGTVDVNSNEFNANRAVKAGGAIYIGIDKNYGIQGGQISTDNGTLNLRGTNTFIGNTAGEFGGAIYADAGATVNFSGTNTFSGNTANGVDNDIHNVGKILVKDGTLSLDGGISGNGTIEFASGSTLKVITDKTKIANTVTTNGANLSLVFNNAFEGDYQLVTGTGSIADGDFTIAANNLYDIVGKTGELGTYTISKKSSEEVAGNVGANAHESAAIDALTSGTSSNETFNAVADAIAQGLQSSNSEEVKAAVEATNSLAGDVAPSTISTQTSNVTQVFSAVAGRLSSGSVGSAADGVASGDEWVEGGAVWVKGLYNKSKLEDDTTHDVDGFDTSSKGVALGVEKVLTDSVKAGIGYAYTKTDINAFLRDSDVYTHTAFAYGEYKPSAWFVNATASYSWSNYKEKKYVLANTAKADYDADALALQAMTGYDFNVNNFVLTPEVGLRYVHIKQDSYTDTFGTKVADNNSDIFTGVFGAKVVKNFACDCGMVFRPELRGALTYDFARDGASSDVVLANGAAYQVDGKSLKRFGMEVGAALIAEVSDSVEVTLGYEGRFRQDYYDNTGLLSAKYKF